MQHHIIIILAATIFVTIFFARYIHSLRYSGRQRENLGKDSLLLSS